MRIVQINSFGHLSTGNVMRLNHMRYVRDGHESWMIWGRTPKPSGDYEWVCQTKAGTFLDVIQTRLFGMPAFHSSVATKRLVDKLRDINPDVVHLHNLHGYYLNIEILFRYLIDEFKGHIYWTLHDCWAFTGHCAHFTYVECSQWKTGCGACKSCPQLDTYPMTYSKRSCIKSYNRKKILLDEVPSHRLTLITPSDWLAALTRDSYLKKFPVEVRKNKVDSSVFRPRDSETRTTYGIGDKFLVIGVASTWSPRKGLDDFLELRGRLPESFAILLVGLSKNQIAKLPAGVIGIERTTSREELACLYSAADIFFNPTYEDNYPTVNLEAEACGIPVITYDTGGCRETIGRHSESMVVQTGDIDSVTRIIQTWIKE